MRRADEDGATLIVNSDHGFKWGAERPCERSSLESVDRGVLAPHRRRVRGLRRPGPGELRARPGLGPGPGADRRRAGRRLRSTAARRERSCAPRSRAWRRPPARICRSIAVRRVNAEALSEKEASEYAKGLRALGYLSGGEPEKLAASGGDRPGITEGGYNNLGVYLRENTKESSRGGGGLREGARAAPVLRVSAVQSGGALPRARRRPKGGRLALPIAPGRPRGTGGRPWCAGRASTASGGKVAIAERSSSADIRRTRRTKPWRGRRASCASRPRTATGRWRWWRSSNPRPAAPRPSTPWACSRPAWAAGTQALQLFRKSLTIQPNQPAVVQSIQLIEKAPPSAN